MRAETVADAVHAQQVRIVSVVGLTNEVDQQGDLFADDSRVRHSLRILFDQNSDDKATSTQCDRSFEAKSATHEWELSAVAPSNCDHVYFVSLVSEHK